MMIFRYIIVREALKALCVFFVYTVGSRCMLLRLCHLNLIKNGLNFVQM